MSHNFSLDDLRAVLGDIPAEPAVPDRAVAVRRRVRHVRQRRSALSAVALALPAVGLGFSRSGGGGADGDPPLPPQLSMTASVPTATPSAQVPTPAITPAQPHGQPTASDEPSAPPRGKNDRTPRRPGPGLAVTMTATATQVSVDEEVVFSVAWSDPDGHYEGYAMSFGDIATQNYERVSCNNKRVHPINGGTQLSHSWSQPGTYHVYYTVQTGSCGAAVESGTASVDVTVLPATDPTEEPKSEPTPAPEPTQPVDSTPAPNVTTDAGE